MREGWGGVGAGGVHVRVRVCVCVQKTVRFPPTEDDLDSAEMSQSYGRS